MRRRRNADTGGVGMTLRWGCARALECVDGAEREGKRRAGRDAVGRLRRSGGVSGVAARAAGGDGGSQPAFSPSTVRYHRGRENGPVNGRCRSGRQIYGCKVHGG